VIRAGVGEMKFFLKGGGGNFFVGGFTSGFKEGRWTNRFSLVRGEKGKGEASTASVRLKVLGS